MLATRVRIGIPCGATVYKLQYQNVRPKHTGGGLKLAGVYSVLPTPFTAAGDLDLESLNRPLAIGAELNGPSTYDPTGEFNGYVRDVRIYSRALSDEEVKLLAEEARSRVTK